MSFWTVIWTITRQQYKNTATWKRLSKQGIRSMLNLFVSLRNVCFVWCHYFAGCRMLPLNWNLWKKISMVSWMLTLKTYLHNNFGWCRWQELLLIMTIMIINLLCQQFHAVMEWIYFLSVFFFTFSLESNTIEFIFGYFDIEDPDWNRWTWQGKKKQIRSTGIPHKVHSTYLIPNVDFFWWFL